jgi:hypothetical protein
MKWVHMDAFRIAVVLRAVDLHGECVLAEWELVLW